MKNSVIKLALKGMESNVLVENLLAMKPEYWLVERLIDGVRIPTEEEFAASRSYPTRNIQIEHKSDFDKENLCISYDYVNTAYSSTPVEDVVEEDEYKKLDTSWHKDDKHPYEVKYWSHTYDHFASEKFELNQYVNIIVVSESL